MPVGALGDECVESHIHAHAQETGGIGGVHHEVEIGNHESLDIVLPGDGAPSLPELHCMQDLRNRVAGDEFEIRDVHMQPT